jgi:hypothetical protein
MTELTMQTTAGDWIPFPTAEDALRARIAELEAELAAESALRKAAQVTNAELLRCLLDLRQIIREEPKP